ncbi:Cytochrome p450 [Thalictrum thalictroides]|uniref:Cytochrome p450 n=1 Tax=Thalictrum thalictroides TaxID=46969 RepID=A0A7J6XAR6_THATH|nr:Cytochrome p450 [Thalictrum thalictroides]
MRALRSTILYKVRLEFLRGYIIAMPDLINRAEVLMSFPCIKKFLISNARHLVKFMLSQMILDDGTMHNLESRHLRPSGTNPARTLVKIPWKDIFVGGTETSSSTIVWAMAELVNNPNMMQKAKEEVRKVVGKKNKVEEEDIQQMNYLKAVVKESLRLHPPAAFIPMETATITNVNGYHVPAKTKVYINTWSIQRDPKLWERPEEFIPERFSNSLINFSGQDFKYIPFGSGRRICPGISFGTMAVELVIANLLYWFDWETPGGEKLDMAESSGLSVIKKSPIKLLPIPISQLP